MAQTAFSFGFAADEGECAADDVDVDEHGEGNPITIHNSQGPVDARSHTLDSLVCYSSSLLSRPARCRICCVAFRFLSTSWCPELNLHSSFAISGSRSISECERRRHPTSSLTEPIWDSTSLVEHNVSASML